MRRINRYFTARCLVLALAVALGLAAPLVVGAQSIESGELAAIDRETRAAVVDGVCGAIAKTYVLGEPAERIVQYLQKQLADGQYDQLTDPVELVGQLEADAQKTNHDGHFGMMVAPPVVPAVAEVEAPDHDHDEARRRYFKERNYGFNKVELLPGNIGYLDLTMFSGSPAALPVAAAAMGFLSNSGALIIDLRQNGGGSASMIRMLATYLFEERKHLISWYERESDETVQSHTLDFVPGPRRPGIPVYVLTSRRTFSAAEEFTFDLQHLGRATVVGETTGGGGHTVVERFVDLDSFRVVMRLPHSRAFNPKNDEGFEGVGIIPDVKVPSVDALKTAHRLAIEARLESEQDETVRNSLQWVQQDLDSQLHKIELSEAELEAYVGSYGPRRVFLENSELYYQRDKSARHLLEPMGEDLFRVGELGYFRLSFGRDAQGAVERVIGLYDDGRQDGNKKDG